MTAVIVTIHVIVCIALICIVLLQTGKGASLGAAFGGSTQTVFGATGSAGFFEKITTGVAVLFMVTSLTLTYMSANQSGESIMQEPVPHAEPIPAAPPTDDVWPEEAAAPAASGEEAATPAAESAAPESAPAEAEQNQ